MKVYTKIVMDINTLKITEEESYEYDGPVAQCGGGSGGGSSGAVDYPEYMKFLHANWLAGGHPDILTTFSQLLPNYNLTATLNYNLNNSPYVGKAAYNPTNKVNAMEQASDALPVAMDDVTSVSDGAVSAFLDDYNDDIDAMLLEYGDDLLSVVTDYANFVDTLDTTDEIEVQLAKYDAAMRDINAISSSAFVIGRQIIASSMIDKKLDAKTKVMEVKANVKSRLLDIKQKAIANTLEVKNQSEQAHMQIKADTTLKKTHYDIEIQRLAIVAFKEQMDKDLVIDHQDAIWNFDIFQKAASVVASIAGGTVSKGVDGPSEAQSAIGGALSGAATGAMIGGSTGNPIGAGIGAGIGAAVGAGAAFL